MEPVEINAGPYYLRQLRADDRIDDRPALVAAFADDEIRRWVTRWRIEDIADAGRYVAQRTDEWAADQRYSWAVAEPTTGDLVGEVDLVPLDADWHTAETGCWIAPAWRGRGVATQAIGTVLRFGAGALGVQSVEYRHTPGNTASAKVATKAGFTRFGDTESLTIWRQSTCG
jgi:RimJ/RimL family protein N-acetyltransferase